MPAGSLDGTSSNLLDLSLFFALHSSVYQYYEIQCLMSKIYSDTFWGHQKFRKIQVGNRLYVANPKSRKNNLSLKNENSVSDILTQRVQFVFDDVQKSLDYQCIPSGSMALHNRYISFIIRPSLLLRYWQ